MQRACGTVTMLASILLLAACVGRFDYVPPAGVETATLSRIVGKSVDDVWQQTAAGAIQRRVVVNGVNRDAGVMTLTYGGDPERYVDCGYVTSYVKNVRGERTYRFPAAAASAAYELMTGKEIVSITRDMALEARIAVTAAPIGTEETRVTVSAQYTLTRVMRVRDTRGNVQTISHLTGFTSDREGGFPGAVVCRATGRLEADVLAAFAP